MSVSLSTAQVPRGPSPKLRATPSALATGAQDQVSIFQFFMFLTQFSDISPASRRTHGGFHAVERRTVYPRVGLHHQELTNVSMFSLSCCENQIPSKRYTVSSDFHLNKTAHSRRRFCRSVEQIYSIPGYHCCLLM